MKVADGLAISREAVSTGGVIVRWFKKKKIYKLTWQYDTYSEPYTELVKAYDPVHA